MASKKCKGCRYWEYTETIGSPTVPEWHCRFGFSPSGDCLEMAAYNIECERKYYREYPEALQLSLKFK